jgi:hypothetical protein
MFDNLNTSTDVVAEKDTLGGGFGVMESGAHNFIIELAYLGQGASGAVSLNLHLKTPDGHTLRPSLWMTSGTAKGGKNTYTDGNGQQQYLPGFIAANHIALLTTGKEIGALAKNHEEKVINLYDFDAQGEVPTTVKMLVDLLEKPITLGLIKQIVDKNVKNDAGKYVPGGETREENEVDKVFHPQTRLTVIEAKAGVESPDFFEKWTAKWTGVTRNRAKGVAAAGAPGMPPKPNAGAGAAKAATPSLFV